MENEKRTETPQEPQLEGAVHDAPTPRRRHRRPSHRNTAAASAEPAAQTESAAAAPAELATQPERAARGTAAAEQPASDAAAPVTPAAAAPAPRDLAAQPTQKSTAEPAVQQKPAAETSGSKPAAQQKPAAEPSGSKSAAQQKGASAPQRPAAPERQKGAAPQRPAGAASEHRGAAPQRSAERNDRKSAAPRNAAANDRRTNANTPRRAAEPPKRPATPQKRPAERSTGDGGWTWRGYLCRLSVVILGTALTLLGAGLIGRWQESRQVRGAMQAVYEELTANRAAVGMACRGLMRGGQELQPRAGAADNRLSATSPTTNPMTLRAPVTPVLRDEAWQVLCASGVMASVRDGELLRDMAGCYADVDRFARQIEKGWAPDPAAAQLGKGAAGRIDRVLRQLEGKYGFRQ